MKEMFCVKCRAKRNVEDSAITLVKTAKGRNMMKAKCPVCGTTMTKFTK